MEFGGNVRVEKKFTIQDFLVIVFCLVGFYFSLHFFYGVINQSLEKINEEPIGTISFKYKSAQRKLLDRILWDRVKQNSPVYNGDIIRTAELSEATVTFSDGNIIDLYEQTLAQIFLDTEEGTAIDFSGGGISLDTSASDRGISLKAGNASVQVEAGATMRAVAPVVQSGEEEVLMSQLSLQVTSGVANFLTEDGAQTELAEGSEIVFNEESNSFVTPEIKVISPLANVKLLTHTNTFPVLYRLQKQNADPTDPIILETSKQRDFSSISQRIELTNLDEISLNMTEGAWYWRIYTESGSSTSNGRLQVIAAPLPVASVPTPQAEFAYRTQLPSIRFVWSDDPLARTWQIEIADNENFSNPILTQTTSQPSIIINTLTAGRYYWRVTPLYSANLMRKTDNANVSTAVQYFDIVVRGELTQASLILPIEGGFLDTNAEQQGHLFSWKYDVEAENYLLSISKNRDLSSPVFQENIVDNYYLLYPNVAQLTEGVWYWGVTKIDFEGNRSPMSRIRSLISVEGKIEQRTLFPPDGYSLAENLVIDTNFTWKSNLPLLTKFQISQTEDFSSIFFERESNSTSISGINLTTGTWYWRILSESEESADALDSAIVYKTDPKILVVAGYLAPTNITNISVNERIIALPEQPITVEWDEVSGAQFYQLRLFNRRNLQSPVFENLIIEGEDLPIDVSRFPDGNYMISIRGMASETSLSSRLTGVTSELNFSLKKLVPISLQSPEANIRIRGIDALLSPGEFQWYSEETIASSRLILTQRNRGLSLDSRSRGQELAPEDIAFSYENLTESFTMPALTPGRWFWTILATNPEGLDISPLYPVAFVVEPIEPFDELSGMNPTNLVTVNIPYLLRQRYIDFSWDLMDEADGYLFKISDLSNNLLFSAVIEGNSYRFDNFAMLGKGRFSWSIEAVLRSPSGEIAKYGKSRTHSLVIDLPNLKAPERENTGELYGL